MNALPAFLSRHRDSIIRALARKAASWDTDDGREQARAANVLFQTALACATERNRTPAIAWASTLRNRSGQSRKYSHALRAVQELERACRVAVLADSSSARGIAELLDELAETADLMRLGQRSSGSPEGRTPRKRRPRRMPERWPFWSRHSTRSLRSITGG